MVNNEKLVLNAGQVSKLLGLSRGSVYRGILTGEIPSVKVGKRLLIPRRSLEKWLAQEASESANALGQPPLNLA